MSEMLARGFVVQFLKSLMCPHLWSAWKKTSRVTDVCIHKAEERHCEKCGKVEYR